MKRNTGVFVLLLILVGAYCSGQTTRPMQDYAKTAADAKWVWDQSRVGPVGTLRGWQTTYDISILFRHNSGNIKVSVFQNDLSRFSWDTDWRSVYRIIGDKLYYVDFTSDGGGGDFLISIDLRTGKEVWRSKIVGLSTEAPIPHSAQVLLEYLMANKEVVMIYGKTLGERYFEIKNAETGETLGHKIFEHVATTLPYDGSQRN